jgi:hypothetical protein
MTMDIHEVIENAEDVGYKRAINDLIQWHTDQVQLLTNKAKEAYAPGGIHIGAVWEGRHVSAVQLMDLAIFHTGVLKVLDEKFVKVTI